MMPNGNLLIEGETCYVITAGDREIGRTRQTVTADHRNGIPVWDVVVHQRTSDGRFDMRDTFVLKRSDLRPILMISEHGEARESPLWHRVAVEYSNEAINVRKETAQGVEHVAHSIEGPVWDANLWGLTIAGMPLENGKIFELPTWHCAKGPSEFRLEVIGKENLETKAGEREVWRVRAGTQSGRDVDYFIDIITRVEIGYEGSGFRQMLGGDCSGL